MLKNGMAVAYTKYLGSHPDIKQRYVAAEKHAKDNKIGIWQGKFILPSDWRNKNKRLSCE